MIKRLFAGLALALLAGCATMPEPLEGDYSESFYPAQATESSTGARVRWGGSVVETSPEADRTCIEILAHGLDGRGRPSRSDQDRGRFLACRDSFLDPEIFTRGREVTVTGRLTGFRGGQVGEFVYDYPLVDADTVYLWPERVQADPYWGPYSRFHYPYYGWPYYRHPLFFGPYWYW